MNSNLKEERIRFYSLLMRDPGCPIPTFIIANWMWIDDAKEEDAYLRISCQASYPVYSTTVTTVENSVNLHLQPGYNNSTIILHRLH